MGGTVIVQCVGARQFSLAIMPNGHFQGLITLRPGHNAIVVRCGMASARRNVTLAAGAAGGGGKPNTGGKAKPGMRSELFGRNSGKGAMVAVPPNTTHVRVWCGAYLDGIEFNGNLIGNRGGSAVDWPLHPGERITGFNVRHGAWIDGLQIVTNQRASRWFGSDSGGSPGQMRVPPGHRLSAVFGHFGDWCNGIGFECTPAGGGRPGSGASNGAGMAGKLVGKLLSKALQ
jgi:hypothetical protein